MVLKFEFPILQFARHQILSPLRGSRLIGNFSHGLRRGLYSLPLRGWTHSLEESCGVLQR